MLKVPLDSVSVWSGRSLKKEEIDKVNGNL